MYVVYVLDWQFTKLILQWAIVFLRHVLRNTKDANLMLSFMTVCTVGGALRCVRQRNCFNPGISD